MVKKKPEISDADFIKHYNEKHAQAAAPVLLKHKIISYSLVCLNPRSNVYASAARLKQQHYSDRLES